MHIQFKPKTKLGEWSARLLLGFILLFIIMQILVASGQEGGDSFPGNLWLSIPGSLIFLCGVAAFLTGIISIIKNKERSALVFITTIIGLFILWMLIIEIFFPH